MKGAMELHAFMRVYVHVRVCVCVHCVGCKRANTFVAPIGSTAPLAALKMQSCTCTYVPPNTPSATAVEEEEEEEEAAVDDTSPALMTGTCRPRLGRPPGVGSCPNPVGITKPGRP